MPVVCCAPESVTREERLATDEVIPEISPGLTREYITLLFCKSGM